MRCAPTHDWWPIAPRGTFKPKPQDETVDWWTPGSPLWPHVVTTRAKQMHTLWQVSSDSERQEAYRNAQRDISAEITKDAEDNYHGPHLWSQLTQELRERFLNGAWREYQEHYIREHGNPL